MGKTNKNKQQQISGLALHPNSRKTAKIAKQNLKKQAREAQKVQQSFYQSVIREKLLWFKKNLLADVDQYSHEQLTTIIAQYLDRFNEELEIISIKHSVGQRKNRQHASREDIIKLTINREKDEYLGGGLECPDLMNKKELKLLREWNGDLVNVQHFKLKRYNKNNLSIKKPAQSNPSKAPASTSVENDGDEDNNMD